MARCHDLCCVIVGMYTKGGETVVGIIELLQRLLLKASGLSLSLPLSLLAFQSSSMFT